VVLINYVLDQVFRIPWLYHTMLSLSGRGMSLQDTIHAAMSLIELLYYHAVEAILALEIITARG
jgi:hypothetical protein